MKYKPDAIRFIDGEDTYLDGIKGYGFEKYAVAAACAGRHNIMLFGAFGSGPRVPLIAGMMELLPALLHGEAEEVRRIYSEADESLPAPEGARPFRLPSSRAGIAEMLGGGNGPKPGEASLAHCGVLLLDELQDYKSSVLQMLRIPAESRRITLTRGGHSAVLPADFQLAAAGLLCPCGNFGREDAVCLCSLNAISSYWRKFLPVIEKTEIRVDTGKNKDFPDMRLEELRTKVKRAWAAQLARQDRLNSRLPKEALDEASLHLETTREQAEALHRMDRREVLSVTSLAMTVADMEEHPKAREEDVEMALRLHGGLDAVLRTAGIKKEDK